MERPINAKQIAFCNEYLSNGLNGTQAALKAYPNSDYNSAMVMASNLLRKPKIQSYLAEAQAITAKKQDITKEGLIKDLNAIKLKGEVGDTFEVRNALKAIEMITKMLGFNAPEQSEITFKVEQPLFGPLLSKDEQKKLNE